MVRPEMPKWAQLEEKKLGEEWVRSNSSLAIDEYILEHASSSLKKWYEEQREKMKKMHFGKVVLPNGEVAIY